MEGKCVVKVNFNGDIRRLSIEDTTTFKELRRIIKKLYKLPNLKISYTDPEGDSVRKEQFLQILIYTRFQSLPILIWLKLSRF